MPSSRKRKSRRRYGAAVVVTTLTFAACASWWKFLRGAGLVDPLPAVSLAAISATNKSGSGAAINLTTISIPPPGAQGNPTPQEASPAPATVTPTSNSSSLQPAVSPGVGPLPPNPLAMVDDSATVSALWTAAQAAVARGDLITARTGLAELWKGALPEPMRSPVRAELMRLGMETVFSPRIFESDPYVFRYVVQSGDSLAKIAQTHLISAEILAAINDIPNANLIRAGQTIKVIRGPFHAEVTKPAYSLDVFLSGVLVAGFDVGLGADDSTPTGTWIVSSKLANPTYYPPRRGKTIAADDPTNPLGEHWIGLKGIEGPAVGQEKYGIHGTIEPDSVGKSNSLGCVRLRNEDVQMLYAMLIQGHSTIVIR